MSSGAKPSVLIGYYTHTQQARRVADVMTEALRDRGCEVSPASIEFTDPRSGTRVRGHTHHRRMTQNLTTIRG